MEAARWQQAKEIFDAALDSPVPSRHAFVAQACGGDADLRRLVEDLLDADDAAGSFLQTGWLKPAAPVPPESYFTPGDVVSGRYRIVRALGGGGMGEVYEAVDSELNVRVALKTIRPEISSNPEVLVRFRQEVRLAHRITHPNVCRTFHLDREVRESSTSANGRVEISFLTMEYLRGQTLRSLLKEKGCISPPQALAIARQIAAALQAAHRAGIVHRDIKPANIMIVPAARTGQTGAAAEDRVVVTDFGLARWQAADTEASSFSQNSISAAGHAIGTLAYMAPEQLHGGLAGPASDIYAFGLVIHEMVTGERFFSEARTPLALGWGNGEAPSALRELASGQGPEWAVAISGCLQADPALRFQSADEVIAALEGAVSAPLKTAAGRPRRRLIVLALALSAAVALLAAGLRLYKGRADATLPEGALVYLAPVRNETGEKQLDDLTELMHGGLAQSARISLLDDTKAAGILQQMTRPAGTEITPAVAREIAMRAGAVRVVFATVSGSGGKYHLNFDIQRPDMTPASFRDHWSHTIDWYAAPASSLTSTSANAISPELLRAVREGSDWVRERVGESANDIARLDAPPEDVTTGNWEALAAYSDAERLSSRGKRADAIDAYRSAVRYDPEFALAFARMGGLLFSLGRAEDGYKAYDAALRDTSSNRLTRRERDFIKGTFAVDTRDFSSAEEAFRDCTSFYEVDAQCTFSRAYPLRMMGRSHEAIGVLNHALQLSPSFSGAFFGEAQDYILTREFDSANLMVGRLKSAQRLAQADWVSGQLAFLRNDFDAANGYFTNLIRSSSPQDRSDGYALLARVAAERGRVSDALNELQLGLIEDRGQHNREGEAAKLLDRSYLYCRMGGITSCIEDATSSLSLENRPESIVAISSSMSHVLGNATISQRPVILRFLSTLQARLPRIETGTSFELARLQVSAVILLAKGDTSGALRVIHGAEVLDSPLSGRECLADMLLAAAKQQPNPVQKRTLLDQALNAYQEIALHPEIVWHYALEYPPGCFADQVEDSLLLRSKFKEIGSNTRAESSYSHLRGALSQ